MTVTATITAKNFETDKIGVTRAHLLKDLCLVSFPLMLSAFSYTLMTFLSRIVLAKYDTHSMIGATTAANICYVFQYGAIAIAIVAEVFVGHLNGAGRLQNIGKPVWQMIWFSLLTGLIMIPAGLLAGPWLIPAEYLATSGEYFVWMMISGPLFPLAAALSSFFIGRGRVKIVTLSVLFGNMVNLLLSFCFIFGIPGLIPALGAKGAALATGITEAIIVMGLFTIFLHPTNQKKYGTLNWRWDGDIFFQCMKIGVPSAVGHTLATAAWAFAMIMMAKKSFDHIAILSIGFTLWMLFSFITEGLQKGSMTLAANAIGANKLDLLDSIIKKGIVLQFSLALLLAVPLLLMPDLLINLFLPLDPNQDTTHLRHLLKVSCFWLWIGYLFDGMAWIIDGVLTAKGDTRFIMFMNAIGTWVFCILPIYIFVVRMNGTALLTLQIVAVFCFILLLSYFLRYKYLGKINFIFIK